MSIKTQRENKVQGTPTRGTRRTTLLEQHNVTRIEGYRKTADEVRFFINICEVLQNTIVSVLNQLKNKHDGN